jgi:S1-C subfamily serine protease
MAPVRHDARLPEGPDLQVQVPVAPGNSGGGAFDDGGHLVGLMDGMLETLPGEGFFVPVEVIRPFLKASHL